MHWDPNELKRKYDEVTKKYNREKKPIIKNDLWNDRVTFSTMYSVSSDEILFDEEYNIRNCQDQKCLEYLQKNFSLLITELNNYLTIRFKNRKPENLEIENYNELMQNFIKNYYPNIGNLYDDLKESKHIELTTNKKFESNYNGECFYSVTLDEIYLFARYNQKILSSGYLPHELGHAYQTGFFESVKAMTSRIQSLFVEVYSTYIERLFHLYLYEVGYTNQAIYLEKKYWQAFVNFIEYQFYYAFGGQNFFNCENIRYILSKLVSNIAIDDYLQKGNHDAIEHFNELFVNADDVEIVKEYSLKRILTSAYSSMGRLINKNSIK